MNRVKDDPNLRSRFPKEAYEEIEEAYDKIKDQFLDGKGRSLGWTLLDMYSLAKKAGYDLDQISVTAYIIPSLKIHASVSDLIDRKATVRSNSIMRHRSNTPIQP